MEQPVTTPIIRTQNNQLDISFTELTNLVMFFIIIHILIFVVNIVAATYVKNTTLKVLLIVTALIPGLNYIAFIFAILILTGAIKV
jgi:hypothetical protein